MLNEVKRNRLQQELKKLQSHFRDVLKNKELDSPEIDRAEHRNQIIKLQEQISMIPWD